MSEPHDVLVKMAFLGFCVIKKSLSLEQPVISGVRLERKCERCGSILQPDAEFCHKCGKGVDGEITASRDVNLAIEILDAREWRILGIALVILSVVLLVLSIITIVLQDDTDFVLIGVCLLVAGFLAFYYGRRKEKKYRILYNTYKPKK
jgi:hypothetical protein